MRVFKKIIFIVVFSLLLSACKSDENEKTLSGNMLEVELQPGDVYAIITFLDYGDVTCKLFPDVAPIAVGKFISLAERGFYEHKTIHRVVKDALIQGGSLNGDGTDGNIDQSVFFDIETSDNARNFYGALGFAPNSIGKNFCQFYIVNNKQSVDIDADILKLSDQLSDDTRQLTPEASEKYSSYLSFLKKIPIEVKERYLSKGGYYSYDGKSSVFGQVIKGFDVIDAISNVEVVSGNGIDDSSGFHSKPFNSIVIEKVKIVRIPLPEPTTTPEETTTEKSKSNKKRTSKTTTRPEDINTDVIVIGDTQSEPLSTDFIETENLPSTNDAEIDPLSQTSVENHETIPETLTDEIENHETVPENIAAGIENSGNVTEISTDEIDDGDTAIINIDTVETLPPPSIEE